MSITDNKILGIDVSHWNGYMDWGKAKSKGCKFGIIKATDFYANSTRGFVDSRALENYRNLKANGMAVGAYCWLQPKVNPSLQASFFLEKFYNSHPTDIPPILDFEDENVNSWSDVVWRAKVWLEEIEKATGRAPVVYTSPKYMNLLPKNEISFLSKYPLHIAHYIQRDYPTVPYPWSKYTFWQYSNLGHYPMYIYGSTSGNGRYWGSSTTALDMNWFNGTLEEFEKFCQTGTITTPPPVPPSPSQEYKAKCTALVLNVRSGAGTFYPIVGTIKKDNIVTVYEEKSGWSRIGNGRWCSSSFLEKVAQETPAILFYAQCNVNTLNIRSGGSTNYQVVGYLKYGEIVPVYEQSLGWYRIGINRWCSGNYMKKI